MDFKKMGVFSPCVSLDSASMVNCLQTLLTNYPSIKFQSVSVDKKYRGFKVFFTEVEDSVVLRKTLLSSEDEPVRIYPLTSYLMIFDVDHKKSPLFERDLRGVIDKKIGKVLTIVKTDRGKVKDWRIEVDSPEFKRSVAFQDFNVTHITLSIPSRNEEVTLRMWCRKCGQCDHFQNECCARNTKNMHKRLEMKIVQNNSNPEHVAEKFTEQASTSSDQNPEKNIRLETTENYAAEIGKEQALSFSKEKNMSQNGPILKTDIKKEIMDLIDTNSTKEDDTQECSKSEIPENNSPSTIVKNVHTSNKKNGASADDDDDNDEVEFLRTVNKPSPSRSPENASSSSFARDDPKISEEESRSSPEAKGRASPNFSFPVTPGPSPSAALKTPKGAEVTTALSERLQDCINQVCAETGVLDRKKLDAFLIHVKKKSNPIRVALNYTTNTKGLKEQLQGVLYMYYNTPQTGTKEDIQFIKWLNGLVERYDGSIPKKRKRNTKTDDEFPSKR